MVCSSDLFAAGAQVGQDDVDAVLVDGAHGGCGNAQFHPTVLTGDPEAALVQVRSEEHTSELQRLMRTSYGVFGVKHTKCAHRRHRIAPTDRKCQTLYSHHRNTP